MPNINLAPTNWAAEQEAIARRRKMAEMLQQQSMQPVERFSTNGIEAPVSWTQGLAKMLQAYQGGQGQREATEAQKALGERYQSEGQGALARGLRSLQGQTIQPDPQEAQQSADLGTPEVGAVNVPPDRMAAMQAFGSHPETKPYSNAIMAQMLKGEEPYSLAEGAKRMQGGKVVAENPKQVIPKEHVIGGKVYQSAPGGVKELGGPGEGTWSEPYNLGGAMVQKNEVTGQVRQAVNRPPQTHVYSPPAVTVTELQDPDNPNGTIKIDARTMKVLGKGPKLTDTGKMETKRQFNMQDIGATIAEAETLLTDKAKPPTGSGIGAAYDYAAGVFGASPAGAVESQKLKAIGGALVSKMPRMEGPQSDRDTALYKEMAGMVGDPTIPIDRRVAALDTVKKLWSKYERLNQEVFSDRRSGPPPGAVQRLP